MNSAGHSLLSVVAQIEALVTEIQRDENTDGSRSSSLLDDILEAIESLGAANDLTAESSIASKVNACAIHLWNQAVSLKTKGNSNALINARLRHVACNLASVAGGDSTKGALKKQLSMAIKTGRAWLDASNPAMADHVLDLADQCLKRIDELTSKSPLPKSGNDKLQREIDQAVFRVQCFRAEAAVALADHDKAVEYYSKCKETMAQLPRETNCLCLLCYNFGLDTFQKNNFQQSVFWLSESHELGALAAGTNVERGKKQAKTLRLLASAYMEWNAKEHWQKALNAAGLANADHSHPAGHHMKTKILLRCNVHDSRIITAFEDTLKHPDIDADLGISTVQLAADHKRLDLAFSGLKLLGVRFQHPPERHRIRICHLELLLKHNESEAAKDLLEETILEQTRGSPLDVSDGKVIHRLLWQQAAKDFEAEQYGRALNWYNCSLGLLLGEEAHSPNAGRLHRNRCSCFLMQGEVERAKEAILEAEKSDGSNLFTQYFKFKVALLENDSSSAAECLMTISKNLDWSTSSDKNKKERLGMISLAAQLAFEKDNKEVAEKALEHLVQYTNVTQALTALRQQYVQ